MRNALHPPTEDSMEYGFISHVLLWTIGVIAALGVVGTTVAFWSMGRQAYRKD